MADLLARADALWRALTYLSVVQLHLRANPLALRAVKVSDMKARPSGHWGTVPGTAWVLAHLGLVIGSSGESEVVPLIGAGHAGLVQRAVAWLTGELGKTDPCFDRDLSGLEALAASFPDGNELGSEVHPLLPAGHYLGGWLGGALAFAQGMALDAPDRVVVPIIGDGECETPTTAASWLAQNTLRGARVLPVVHLNGYRMGDVSLLGAMNDDQVSAYARGLGWEPVVTHVRSGSPSEHLAFHQALCNGLGAAGLEERHVIFLRCVKGWSGPSADHKTPLTNLGGDKGQRLALLRWMSSYRPQELFDSDAQPIGVLSSALADFRLCYHRPAPQPAPEEVAPQGRGFSTEVSGVLRTHAMLGDFKVFSPDEMRSNRLGDLTSEAWVHEVLAEEVLLGWLAGWTASGRRGVLISYEAFASLLLTGLVGHLKQRRLDASSLPSINVLLTSYGWQNVYTHGDPSLITALLATRDPAVHVFTPADASRVAVALDDALRSTGQVNIILAGKHSTTSYQRDTLEAERRDGIAVWHHVSDLGEPDLTLVCAGDLAAVVVVNAAECIRKRHQCRVRIVNIHDLTALRNANLRHYFGEDAHVLVATLGHPAAIWGLFAGRVPGRMMVLGWREPPHPMSQERLAAYAGMDTAGVCSAAMMLLADEGF